MNNNPRNLPLPQTHPMSKSPNSDLRNLPNYGVPAQSQRQSENPEKLMKSELIKILKEKIEPKLAEEQKKMSQQSSRLKNYKKYFSSELERLDSVLSNRSEIEGKLDNEMEKISKEIEDLSQNVNSNQEDSGINSGNAMNFVNGNESDFKIIELVSKEAYYEDLINAIKKAFKSEAISLTEAVKQMRLTSRDQLFAKYLRKKMLNQKV